MGVGGLYLWMLKIDVKGKIEGRNTMVSLANPQIATLISWKFPADD